MINLRDVLIYDIKQRSGFAHMRNANIITKIAYQSNDIKIQTSY